MKAKNHSRNKNSKTALLSEASPFAVKEAYKHICMNMMFSINSSGEPSKVFAITSSVAGEGKSTTAANLALSFASMGKNVLLIDADMRRSAQQKLWGFPESNGLSNLLSGVGECKIHGISALPISIIGSGDTPPNPSELLSASLFPKMIARLKKSYDYILIDTPPINLVSDTQIILKQADGIVMVVGSGTTDKRDLNYAMKLIAHSNAKCCGFILNKINPKHTDYGYSYSRSYGYDYDYDYDYA